MGIIVRMERRCAAQAGDYPIDTLRQLPTLVMLERLPVATLAVAGDGEIVFANTACANMLGYDPDEFATLQIRDLFHALRAAGSVVAALHEYAELVVELAHKDGSIVRARMSKSALLREDDTVVLAAFHDLTEQLWAEEL
jgi:PAS domain S-box-containing protein